MSSLPSEQPLQLQESNESDVVYEGSLSLNQETPNQPPKSDLETVPSPRPIPDPEDNSAAEEEEEDADDEEGEETDETQEQETLAISSGMPLLVDRPITEPHVAVSDARLTSVPTNDPHTRRAGAKKRKKAKSKNKTNIKQLQAIEEKVRSLSKKLKPIPFIPHKLLDFPKHEKLLKKLGLWDFVQINFDRNIRTDLIAELVANYGVKSRASYVKGSRINVNRADLARAFKLPLKKEKGNVAVVVEVDSGCSESLSGDSIGFIGDFVSDWVLLHEDMWLTPKEVMEWLKVIKDGHPEKVDWAGLIWFMVEKELKKGDQLTDCYYASHLQHLIKYQRGEEFLMEEPAPKTVKLDTVKEEEEEGEEDDDDEVEEGNITVGGATESHEEEDCVMEGPNTELTLGQDGENEEELKDGVEMMEIDKGEEIDEDGGEEEQGDWLLHGKNNFGEHFMQRCSAENAGDFGISEDRKDDEEEEEIDEEEEDESENQFHGFSNDEDGFTGNLLQTMEASQQMGFTSLVAGDMQHIDSATPSFFNDTGKRVIGQDNHHSANDSSKRMRLNDSSWDHNNNKPVDFGMCMEQIQQMTERARMFYEEKEQNLVHSNMNQQILLAEVQKRDAMIEHLHKTRLEETQKKDGEIYRLEREIYLMGGVLEGYRKALKDVQKSFAEYKEKAQLPEEPTYKDVGSGGLMLTTAELEKLRKKQEEEYKMNCLVLEQKMKAFEDAFAAEFEGHVEKVNLLDKKLMGLEAESKELIESYAKGKFPQTEEALAQVDEPLPITPPEEKVPEAAAECVLIPETEEVPEIAEPLPNE